MSTLVVGHDGSPCGDAALATAIDLASRLAASVEVVHCVTLDDYGVDPDSDDFEAICERNRGAERDRIAAAFGDAPIPWTYHEARGDPAQQLADLAATVDALLIVVGASQAGMVHHVFSPNGSVSKRLLHRQGRPVLVVPVDGHAGP